MIKQFFRKTTSPAKNTFYSMSQPTVISFYSNSIGFPYLMVIFFKGSFLGVIE